jgi:ribonuclease T2
MNIAPTGRARVWNPRNISRPRALYERVSVPQRFRAADSGLLVSPEEVERAFLDANPWLKPEMISIACRKAHLLDIRLCFGRDLAPRACGANEIRGGFARRRR